MPANSGMVFFFQNNVAEDSQERIIFKGKANSMDGKKHIPPCLIGLIVVIAIQVAGFALLWEKIVAQQEYVYLSAENSQGATAGAQTTPVVAAIRLPDEGVLRETIQSVLHQELTPYLRQLAVLPETAKTPVVESPGVAANSPANMQALNDTNNIVSGAIARGVWTNENSLALIKKAGRLTRSQREEIMLKIADAVNRQELTLKAVPPGL